jgi:hypothetical protein
MAKTKWEAWLHHGRAGTPMRTEGPFDVSVTQTPVGNRKSTGYLVDLCYGKKRRVYREDRGAFLYIRDQSGENGRIRVQLREVDVPPVVAYGPTEVGDVAHPQFNAHRDVIRTLVAIIDQELLPNARNIAIKDALRLNDGLIAARRLLGDQP